MPLDAPVTTAKGSAGGAFSGMPRAYPLARRGRSIAPGLTHSVAPVDTERETRPRRTVAHHMAPRATQVSCSPVGRCRSLLGQLVEDVFGVHVALQFRDLVELRLQELQLAGNRGDECDQPGDLVLV